MLGTFAHLQSESLCDGSFTFYIRWRRFLSELLDHLVELERLLRLGTQPAHIERALLHFAFPGDENDGNLRHRMLADLVVDLLITQIGLDAKAGSREFYGYLAGVGIGIRDDGGHDRLGRCKPQREMAGKILDEYAEKALH